MKDAAKRGSQSAISGHALFYRQVRSVRYYCRRGVRGSQTQPSLWRAHRVATAGFHIGHSLALERYRGCGADRWTRGIDVLVRPAISADVPGSPSDVARWHGILVKLGGELRVDCGALFHHGLGTGQVWNQSLAA